MAVVIPNRNGAAFLRRNVPSLGATDYPNWLAAMADNVSTDESVELVRRDFGFCEVIEGKEDRGFAGNVNRGLRWGLERQAKYIAVISNDVSVPAAWLSCAVVALEGNPSIGILGFTEEAGQDELRTPEKIKVEETVYPSGCAFILRSDVVRRVGLYDEILYMYGEEQDYYPRVLKAGFGLVRINVPIFHEGQGYSQRISKRTVRLCYRNAIYCALKNFGLTSGVVVSAKIFCYAVLPGFLLERLRASALADLASEATLSERSETAVDTTGLLRGQNVGFRFWAFLVAMTWNILHLAGTLEKRRLSLRLAKE